MIVPVVLRALKSHEIRENQGFGKGPRPKMQSRHRGQISLIGYILDIRIAGTRSRKAPESGNYGMRVSHEPDSISPISTRWTFAGLPSILAGRSWSQWIPQQRNDRLNLPVRRDHGIFVEASCSSI
jgi:hypothetical protein